MCVICNGKIIENVIDCKGCPNLVSISNIQNIKELNCQGCVNLIAVSNITNVTKILCSNCPNLKTISNIEKSHYLRCHDCPELTTMFKINVKILGITSTKLREVPKIKNLTYLYCSFNKYLNKIPNNKKITYIDCTECTYLKKIPNITNMTGITFSRCPFLYIPQDIHNRLYNFDQFPITNYKSKLLILKLKRFIKKSKSKTNYKRVVCNLPITKDVMKYLLFRY